VPEIQQYTVEVEVRVKVLASGSGFGVIPAASYSTRATFRRCSTKGAVSELIESAVLKAASYSRAHAAAVDNNEARRLK
jgi:RNA 3'-terminal phosphate cyclase